MVKINLAVVGDDEGHVLLRSQGCFLSRWAHPWLIGNLFLSARCFAFTQHGGLHFKLPLARITGLAVKRRKFVLVHKEIIQMTYALTDREREKQAWFIAPELDQWFAKLDGLTDAGQELCGPSGRHIFRPSPPSLRRTPKGVWEAEPVRVREDQLRDLAATVGALGARVLRYLWKERHANIEELAALVDAPTHMDVLTLLREGINAPASRLLGGPVLVFKERAFDADTGRNICFQWWMEREDVGEPCSVLPLVEIHDEVDALLVVVTIPRAGVKPPRAKVRDSGRRLVLTVEEVDDSWEMTLPLPCRVLAIPTEAAFTNGVLSLWLAKKTKE